MIVPILPTTCVTYGINVWRPCGPVITYDCGSVDCVLLFLPLLVTGEESPSLGGERQAGCLSRVFLALAL